MKVLITGGRFGLCISCLQKQGWMCVYLIVYVLYPSLSFTLTCHSCNLFARGNGLDRQLHICVWEFLGGLCTMLSHSVVSDSLWLGVSVGLWGWLPDQSTSAEGLGLQHKPFGQWLSDSTASWLRNFGDHPWRSGQELLLSPFQQFCSPKFYYLTFLLKRLWCLLFSIFSNQLSYRDHYFQASFKRKSQSPLKCTSLLALYYRVESKRQFHEKVDNCVLGSGNHS